MDREEFIGKLQMVYVGDKNASKDIIAEYDNLQQKVEQLEERCEYLERSNNRREDEIIELRDENVDLVSKNNQLENIRKEAIERIERGYVVFCEQDKECLLNFRKNMLNILNKGSDKDV